MTQHMMRIPQGFLHYSTVDAKFLLPDGRPVYMEFHRYCGPMFMLSDGVTNWEPEDENDPIWSQFEGWWEAKGKKIYGDYWQDVEEKYAATDELQCDIVEHLEKAIAHFKAATI